MEIRLLIRKCPFKFWQSPDIRPLSNYLKCCRSRYSRLHFPRIPPAPAGEWVQPHGVLSDPSEWSGLYKRDFFPKPFDRIAFLCYTNFCYTGFVQRWRIVKAGVNHWKECIEAGSSKISNQSSGEKSGAISNFRIFPNVLRAVLANWIRRCTQAVEGSGFEIR